MRKWLPSTKLMTAVGVLLASQALITLGEHRDLYANVPEPWRTLLVGAITAAAGWLVKERNLTVDQLHGKGQ